MPLEWEDQEEVESTVHQEICLPLGISLYMMNQKRLVEVNEPTHDWGWSPKGMAEVAQGTTPGYGSVAPKPAFLYTEGGDQG